MAARLQAMSTIVDDLSRVDRAAAGSVSIMFSLRRTSATRLSVAISISGVAFIVERIHAILQIRGRPKDFGMFLDLVLKSYALPAFIRIRPILC